MLHLGDALTWRCLNLATPHPGDALSGQPVDFPPWIPWMGPTICLTLALTLTLTLSLVNARGRDGTQAPSLELTLVSAKRLRSRPIIHVAFLLT